MSENRDSREHHPDSGDKGPNIPDSRRRLRRALYDELRFLASRHMYNERTNHTLPPTALVHEAYLKLSGQDQWDLRDRKHFLRIASNVMRQILVDHARKRTAQKRGGKQNQVPLFEVPGGDLEFGILDLHRALDELSNLDEQASRIVEMKVFIGMKMDEIADTLEVSKRTVESDWQMARMWLGRRLS